jgi:hypothetical protein
MPRLIVENHPNQNVSGKHLSLDGMTLTTANLDLFLHGNHDFEHFIGNIHRLDAVQKVLPHLVLVSRVGMQDVPFPLLITFSNNTTLLCQALS